MVGLFTTFFSVAHTTFACSGGPESSLSLEESIENASIIVEATVIEVDDWGNGVLQVHRYLGGTTRSKYLIMYDRDPVYSAVKARGYDTGCFYGFGGYDSNPSLEFMMRGYFLLSAGGGISHYASYSGTNFIGEDTLENVEAFEELVSDIKDMTPVSPDSTSYPLSTPLLITTNAGEQYSLSIDGNTIQSYTPSNGVRNNWNAYAYPDIFNPMPACYEVGCRMSIPDRSFFGDVMDDGTIIFDYPFSKYLISSNENAEKFQIIKEGNAFMFSPTGEGLIIWNQDEITIYRVSNTYCSCLYGSVSPSLSEVSTIQSIQPWQEIETLTYPWELVRWSPDGTTLIYSDIEGLWLVDIFRNGVPERIARASGGDLIYPILVSTAGRYIGYTTTPESHEWITLDRIEGETYMNALPSPNERYLAYFTERDGVFPPRGDVPEYQCIYLPCSYGTWGYPEYFQWMEYDGKTYIFKVQCEEKNVLTSNTPQTKECQLSTSRFGYQTQYDYRSNLNKSERINTRLFTYESGQNVLAYVEGESTITIGNNQYDLTGQINGSIIGLQWLSSVFYYTDGMDTYYP